MEINQEEILHKLNVIEQRIQQIQQQLQAIEEGVSDIKILEKGLDELKLNEFDDSNGKEIMASLGRGIFVNAKIISDKVTVDVGGGNFVKKSSEETKKLLRTQLVKLGKLKKDLKKDLEKNEEEFGNLIEEFKDLEDKNKDKN